MPILLRCRFGHYNRLIIGPQFYVSHALVCFPHFTALPDGSFSFSTMRSDGISLTLSDTLGRQSYRLDRSNTAVTHHVDDY